MCDGPSRGHHCSMRYGMIESTMRTSLFIESAPALHAIRHNVWAHPASEDSP